MNTDQPEFPITLLSRLAAAGYRASSQLTGRDRYSPEMSIWPITFKT